MDDHPNFGRFLPIGIFLIGVVKGRHMLERKKIKGALYSPFFAEALFTVLVDTVNLLPTFGKCQFTSAQCPSPANITVATLLNQLLIQPFNAGVH